MKIEWVYKGQSDFLSYHETESLIESADYLDNLIQGKTDYNYAEMGIIRISLNNWLKISITKNFLGNTICYLMCGEYEIGTIDSIENVKNLMINFNAESDNI